MSQRTDDNQTLTAAKQLAPRSDAKTPTSPIRRSWRPSARSIGSFVPGITQKAFEKYGFSTATLITDWKMIAGLQLAKISRPEKLSWPRSGKATIDAGDFSDTTVNLRPGATLILRVEPAHALDLQYNSQQLLERINTFYGYRAIERLKILQAPLPRTKQSPINQTVQRSDKKVPASAPLNICDRTLRDALTRLHASVVLNSSDA